MREMAGISQRPENTIFFFDILFLKIFQKKIHHIQNLEIKREKNHYKVVS